MQHRPLALLLGLGGAFANQEAHAAPFFEAAAAAAKQVLVMLECSDENGGCSTWAAGGECERNPGFMHGACRKSCGRCELQNEDALHALETVAYATRNHHAGCATTLPVPMPLCDGAEERLSAVLAMMQERASGKALQRFIEALALEIAAPPPHVAESTFAAQAPTGDSMIAASVGATTRHGAFVTLSDGGRMPSVGLGTWLTVGQECYEMVTKGLRAGLRHIDTRSRLVMAGLNRMRAP